MGWLAGTDSEASDTLEGNDYQDRKASETTFEPSFARAQTCDGKMKSTGDDMVEIDTEVEEEEREVGSSRGVLLRGCDEAGVLVAKL